MKNSFKCKKDEISKKKKKNWGDILFFGRL